MKVLMLSNICTHPHNMGNRQRIYRECCQMQELGWQIDFLFWGGKFGGNIQKMKDFFGKEHFYSANVTSIKPRYQLKQIFRIELDKRGLSKYFSVFYNKDELFYKEIEEKIKVLIQREKYDVIWLQYAYQSKILENMPQNIFTVIDTHDIFAYRNRIYQKKGRIPEGFYTTRRQERLSLSRADLVVAIQDEEEKYFRKQLKNCSVECITLGDMVEFHKSSSGKKKVFGFIGAENDANVVGVHWLAEEVLPLIYEMDPECRCVIAGGICNLISEHPYYVKLGRVETLQEYYDQISVAINPVQNGTGLNIKGIEALSYGKPLISTKVGAKGLADAESAMIVCDNARQFAEQVVRLLSNGQECVSRSMEAERFILKYNEKNRNTLLKIEQMALRNKEVSGF